VVLDEGREDRIQVEVRSGLFSKKFVPLSLLREVKGAE